MKLRFSKDDDAEINVHCVDAKGLESEFSYESMIKSLLSIGELEDPEISENFTDAEADSIKRMIRMINEKQTTEPAPANSLLTKE